MKKDKRRSNTTYMRRTPKIVHRFEREIARLGRQQFDYIRSLYREHLITPMRGLTFRVDADESDIERLKRLLEQITRQGQTSFNRQRLEPQIRAIINQLDASARQQISSTFGNDAVSMIYNREIEGIINRTVTNTSLEFQASSDRTAKSLASRISSGIIAGERHESIAKGITSMMSDDGDERKSATNRAKFIARNTVSRTLGELNKTRQESSGIQLYTWQTSEDERVRPTHVDLNGRVFSWSGTVTVDGVKYEMASDPDFNNGAPTIPGMPWNCRCAGLAYIPELED